MKIRIIEKTVTSNVEGTAEKTYKVQYKLSAWWPWWSTIKFSGIWEVYDKEFSSKEEAREAGERWRRRYDKSETCRVVKEGE